MRLEVLYRIPESLQGKPRRSAVFSVRESCRLQECGQRRPADQQVLRVPELVAAVQIQHILHVVPDHRVQRQVAAVRGRPQVGKLIDGIDSADLFVGCLPEPREPLLEQFQHHSINMRVGRFSWVTRSPRSLLL
jgi:hypothetical protein